MSEETEKQRSLGRRLFVPGAILVIACVVCFGAVALFGDGDGEDTPTRAVEATVEVIEGDAEPTEVEEPTEEPTQAPTDTPASTDTPEPTNTPRPTATEDVASQEEDDYREMVAETSDRFGSSMGEFGNRMTRLSENPALMFDDDFRLEMAIYIADIELAAEEIVDYEPVPARFQNFHSQYEEMAELMLEAMDEYTYGLDNIDPEAIDRGNRLIQQATDIINEIPIEDIAE